MRFDSGTHHLGSTGPEPPVSPGSPAPRAAGRAAPDHRPDDDRRRTGRPRAARQLGPRLLLPDPPLVDTDAGIRLRPWTTAAGDVAALVSAWTDPVITAANGVPQDVSARTAARWLAEDGARLAAGRCLDLVVSPLDRSGGDPSGRDLTDRAPSGRDRPGPDPAGGGPGDAPSPVLGEVGLRNIDRVHRRAEVSWWTATDHRGRGLATAATRVLAAWALDPRGGGLVQVWARIHSGNPASARVAARAGFECRGTVDGTDVWARVR